MASTIFLSAAYRAAMTVRLIDLLDEMDVEVIDGDSIPIRCFAPELDNIEVRDLSGKRPFKSKNKHQRRKAKGYY